MSIGGGGLAETVRGWWTAARVRTGCATHRARVGGARGAVVARALDRKQTGLSRATVSRILRRLKPSRIRDLDPPRRSNDTSTNIRATCCISTSRVWSASRGPAIGSPAIDATRSRASGAEYVHVAIDDHSICCKPARSRVSESAFDCSRSVEIPASPHASSHLNQITPFFQSTSVCKQDLIGVSLKRIREGKCENAAIAIP